MTATNAVGTGPASAASTAVTPRATILDFARPGTADSGDAGAVELGVKFTTDFPGTVTGIRFHKAAGNTGTHSGSLWTAGGTRLAQATFQDESASGWQHVTFSSPVAVSANTTYVASYFAPAGHYSVTSGGFSHGDRQPAAARARQRHQRERRLHLRRREQLPDVELGRRQLLRSTSCSRPPAHPGRSTGVSATAGQSSATVNWTAPASGGPVTSYKITPYIGAAAQTAKTVTGSPPATSTTVTGLTGGHGVHVPRAGLEPERLGPGVRALQQRDAAVVGRPVGPDGRDRPGRLEVGDRPLDGAGQRRRQPDHRLHRHAVRRLRRCRPPPSAPRNARVTGLTNGTAHTFTVTATNASGTSPASGASQRGDAARVALRARHPDDGRRRRHERRSCSASSSAPTVAGSVTGLRFYKAAANTGTHVGRLWSTSGTLLAEGTFSGETASGWQALTFAHAGRDHRRHDLRRELPRAQRPLLGHRRGVRLRPVRRTRRCSALARTGRAPTASTPTAPRPVFPTASFNASNYWVDVLFAPAA